MFDPEAVKELTDIIKSLKGRPLDQVSLLVQMASEDWIGGKDDEAVAQTVAAKGLVMIGMILVLQHPEWAVAAIDTERKRNPQGVMLAETLSNLAMQIAPIEENDV